jgi:hypothetical protein
LCIKCTCMCAVQARATASEYQTIIDGLTLENSKLKVGVSVWGAVITHVCVPVKRVTRGGAGVVMLHQPAAWR